MKKLFLSVAIICAMCSCTSESYFDQEIPAENANVMRFSIEDEKSAAFEAACHEIVRVHKDIEIFRDCLPKNLMFRIDQNVAGINDKISAIRFWWENDETYEIMREYPSWDDFLDNISEENVAKYEFYF